MCNAAAVGVDLLIGEPDYIGRGLGPEMLRTFIREVLPFHYPTAVTVVADPVLENSASIRAFEKASFVRGQIVPAEDGGLEQLMILAL
jgi:RimJ/RimL family protein N-acetyltransferase